MPTPRQGNLFEDSPEARECVQCEQMFVPEEDHHEYCSKCFDRRQKRKPRRGESGAVWIQRMYGCRS